MTYCGAESIADLRVKARFVQVTHSGQIESHPHDIELARSAPNYRSSLSESKARPTGRLRGVRPRPASGLVPAVNRGAASRV